MDNYELISEFLDGALDFEDEEKLFSLFSNDASLRSELKQQLAIKNAINNDSLAYMPKSSSTINIFNELGLILPAPIPVVSPSIGAKLLSFIKNNSGYIYTGIISSVATLFITFLLLDFTSGNSQINNSNINQKHNLSKTPIISNIAKDNFDDLNNQNKTMKTNKQNETSKIIYKYIYINDSSAKDYSENNKKLKNQDFDINNKQNNIQNFNLISNSEVSRNYGNDLKLFDQINLINNQSLNPIFTDIEYFNNFNNFNNTLSNDFTIELHSSSYKSNSLPELKQNNMNLLNTGVSLFYNVNNELKIGIDYRRESFFQHFSGVENGATYFYEQEPNFETYSFLTKYNPNYLKIMNFTPYTMLSIGANASGPVGRISVGTDLFVSNSLYLNFGFDYNILLYTQNKANFVSKKIGFYLGAGLNF